MHLHIIEAAGGRRPFIVNVEAAAWLLLGPTIGEPIDTATKLPGASLEGATLHVHGSREQRAYAGESFVAQVTYNRATGQYLLRRGGYPPALVDLQHCCWMVIKPPPPPAGRAAAAAGPLLPPHARAPAPQRQPVSTPTAAAAAGDRRRERGLSPSCLPVPPVGALRLSRTWPRRAPRRRRRGTAPASRDRFFQLLLPMRLAAVIPVLVMQ
jgi:hypothetical protein